MTIKTQRLDQIHWLVRGEDSEGNYGEQVLHSPVWADVIAHHKLTKDVQKIDDAISDVLAPVLSAIDEVADDQPYDWSTVEVEAGFEGKSGVTFTLDEHGVLLRLIKESDQSNLLWVNGSLVAVGLFGDE